MHIPCPCVCVVSLEICAVPRCKNCRDRNVMSHYCVTQCVTPVRICGLLCFVPSFPSKKYLASSKSKRKYDSKLRMYKYVNPKFLQGRLQKLKINSWYMLIYLSTAIGLTPGGNSTAHIYTQTIHITTQLTTLVGRLSGIRTQSDQTKINDEVTA
jgi:hypothetical protein